MMINKITNPITIPIIIKANSTFDIPAISSSLSASTTVGLTSFFCSNLSASACGSL